MNDELIYVKTPFGEDAVRDRTRLVQRNLRMVLIMVDGLTNVSALKHKAGDAALIENSLVELEKIGLIEPFGARATRSVDAAATKSIMMDHPVSEYFPDDVLEPEETIFEPVEPRLAQSEDVAAIQEPIQPTAVPPSPSATPKPFLTNTLSLGWNDMKQRWIQAREERAYEKAYGTPTSAQDGYPPPSTTVAPRRRYRKINLRKRVLGILFLGFAVVVLAVIFYPYDEYRPELETQLTSVMGEEVRIDGDIKLRLMPAPAIVLERLSTGGATKRNIEVDRLRLLLDPRVIVGGNRYRKVELEGLTVHSSALSAAAHWFQPGVLARNNIKQLLVKDISLDLGWTRLPVESGTVLPDKHGDGSWLFASDLANGALHVEATPIDSGLRVSARGAQWKVPLDPSLDVTSLDMESILTKDQLFFEKIEARAYDGMLTGKGNVTWHSAPELALDMSMQRIAIGKLLGGLQGKPAMVGELSGRLQVVAQPPSSNWLGQGTRIDGTATVVRGALKGLNLAEVLKEGGDQRGAIRGGETTFEELSGKFALDAGQLRIMSARLSSGRMTASGQTSVTRNTGSMTGSVNIEMRGSARAARAVATISGNAAMPELRVSRQERPAPQ